MSDEFTTVESYPKGTKIKILRLPDNNPDKGLIGQTFPTHELQDRKGCRAYAVKVKATAHYPALEEMILCGIERARQIYTSLGLEIPKLDEVSIFLFEQDACKLIPA